MKVYVYAICKDEEQFVNRWVDSMEEADKIFVLDTGSTDNTIDKLKKRNVYVKQKIIKPWRFDVARNESLKLIPKDADICVCTDLDEVFNKGWRKELEKVWKKDTNRCRYIYNWSLDKNNKPIVSFYYEKIHSLKDYKWIYPVHEVLTTPIKENYCITDKIVLNHYPDSTKSRSNYLPLLELSVKEEKESDRNTHYLGREYMFHQEYKKAIKTLKKHINLKTATWKDEKSASKRFIGRCYKCLNNIKEARKWYKKAIKEAPYLRDPYVELGILEYENNNYQQSKKYLEQALQIKNHERTYINEPFSWNHTIHDILSIIYYNENNLIKSYENIKKATLLKSDDKRLKENEVIIKEQLLKAINNLEI